MALQQRIEAERLKHQEKKQRHKDEHRKEEEQRKQLDNAKKEKQPTKAPAAKKNTAQVVSPSKPASIDAEMENASLKINLFPIMHGKENGTEDSKNCKVVYHGVTSSFFGIGILPVSDLFGGWYFRSVLLIWRELLFSAKGGLAVSKRGLVPPISSKRGPLPPF